MPADQLLKTLTLGLSLSLSGRYAAMGGQAFAALQLFVSEANLSGGIQLGDRRLKIGLNCEDDGSSAERCAAIYRRLCAEEGADVILGPYSSGLCRVAVPIARERGKLLINHGGADDDLYQAGGPFLVSILTPASGYLVEVARLLAQLKLWRKRVATVGAPAGFSRAVIDGFERTCQSRPMRRAGLRIRLRETFDPNASAAGKAEARARLVARLSHNRLEALVSAGSFEDEVALIRDVADADLDLPVIACVAAGVQAFARQLGPAAEGIIGPSQWEDQLSLTPELGPTPREFARRMRALNPSLDCDYPAAQAYAAALLMAAAMARARDLGSRSLHGALLGMRTSTLYGDFALDPLDGRQTGHRIVLVQWYRGEKILIDAEAHAQWAASEAPSRWRLLARSLFGASERDDSASRGSNEGGNGGCDGGQDRT